MRSEGDPGALSARAGLWQTSADDDPREARRRGIAPAQGACDARRGEGLIALDPPCRDDAVNRAAMAALQAARALIDSKWRGTAIQDGIRTGGRHASRALSRGFSLESLQKLLDRFERLSASLKLAPDFTQYLRTLIEDGLEADAGEGRSTTTRRRASPSAPPRSW